MVELDTLLSTIENPMRRRILRALVKEPHYPLQLSKELGVSQQAVVKNLEVLERNGLVSSCRQSSSIGPDRILYRPCRRFSITIDLYDGMFETRMTGFDEMETGEGAEEPAAEPPAEFGSIMEMLSELDDELEEIGKERMKVIRKRSRLVRGFLDDVSDIVPGYAHRDLLYEMMNNPRMDLSSLSEEMDANAANINRMVDDIKVLLETR